MRAFDKGIFLIVGCSTALAGHTTFAQSASMEEIKLEEIIVTAERRSSDIQKTATSVSVRSGEELEQQGRYSLTEILRDIPNVSGGDPTIYASGGSETRGGGISIRGVSGNQGGGGAGSPLSGSATTAVYVDGVYEGIGGDYDLQRVEVLRGPQGTLYGRSATSGVVGIYTRDPSLDAVSGDANVQIGNYTRQLYNGAVNIPLGDKLGVRVSASKNNADEGYYDGAGGAYDRTHGRIKALYQASENLSILLGLAFEENDQNTGGCDGTSPADGVIVYDSCVPVNTTHNHNRQYWLDFKWDLGSVMLSYQPALRTYEQKATSALSFAPGQSTTQTIVTPHDHFMTQELRLSSNTESRLTWQTGAFVYTNSANVENSNRWNSSGALLSEGPTSRDTRNYGIFGEATYALTPANRLTLGARYDYTRVSTSQTYTQNLNFSCNLPGFPPSPSCDPGITDVGRPELYINTVVGENTAPSGLREWWKGNYKVRFEHDLASENMLYATISTGFIPGDVNVSNGVVTPYDAEVLTSYEIGSKNRFLDDRLQLNGNVFFYDYEGYQVQVQPDPNLPFGSYTATVPARMQGLELEFLYQFTPRDRFGLNYAYLEARYVDKPAQFATDVTWEHIAPNAGELAAATPHTVTANYEHTFDLPGGSTLLARIDGIWASARRTQNPSPVLIDRGATQYIYTGDETVGNANVNWISSDGKYSVGAYVRNFTDHVRTNYDFRSLAPQRDVRVASQTDPRTYGLMLSARF